MKINDIVFYGFTKKELEAIRNKTERTGNEEFELGFTQEVADATGVDLITLIRPGGQVALIKAGE